MIVLEAQDLKKVYGNGQQQVVALDQFNIEVKECEFMVIVGPSGCGKTTFLLLAAGLEKLSDGDLTFKGKSISRAGANRGIVFQEYALFPWRTVAGNIEFGPEVNGLPKKDRIQIAEKYIRLVDLLGFENCYPFELSGGMQQKVAIARALANKPEILLMDEPFGSLDALTQEILQTELLRIWRDTKCTIIFVTHNITEAIYLGDRVAVMSKRPGKINEIIKIDIKKPRAVSVRTTAEFIEYEKYLKTQVGNEV